MRFLLPCVALLLLALVGYAYMHNPAGCAKLGHDLVAVFTETSANTDAPTAVPSTNSTPPPSPRAPAVTAAPPSAPVPPPPAIVAAPAAPSSPVTAAASTNAPADAPPPFKPFKRWTPPVPFPAQPNWTWTTSDGKTYEKVVITKIESNIVSITHSLGATHLDISTVPEDVQKQLNYDPETAAAVKAEVQREEAHPFYPMSSIAEAEALARQMHWPIAWLFSGPEALTIRDPSPDTWEGLTQMALKTLKTRTIIIYEKGNEELPLVPAAVITELFHLDDGPLPDGHHYNAPKVVFSNADATKTFGRVSYTQMKASGQAAIDDAFASIQDDPAAQAILNGQSAPAPAASAK